MLDALGALAGGADDGRLDRVRKLAHVAWPLCTLQRPQRPRREKGPR